MRSVSVVFPESICALIPMFRRRVISSGAALEKGAAKGSGGGCGGEARATPREPQHRSLPEEPRKHRVWRASEEPVPKKTARGEEAEKEESAGPVSST